MSETNRDETHLTDRDEELTDEMLEQVDGGTRLVSANPTPYPHPVPGAAPTPHPYPVPILKRRDELEPRDPRLLVGANPTPHP